MLAEEELVGVPICATACTIDHAHLGSQEREHWDTFSVSGST